MYFSIPQDDAVDNEMHYANSHVDLDEVMGDMDSCMQSPECTDHTTPPSGS